jgi:hypothetical protein
MNIIHYLVEKYVVEEEEKLLKDRSILSLIQIIFLFLKKHLFLLHLKVSIMI